MFRTAMNVLKKASNCGKPIKVRRLTLKGLDGSCEERNEYFLVKINKSLSESHSIDVLMHEIAHADAWGKTGNYTHGLAWAASYSRLYRIWEKYLEGN